MEKQLQYDVMEVCLLAGKILLQSGAETHRVEDTMIRMAKAFGIAKCESFVIPTGIIFSVGETEAHKTKLVRVSERTTDLLKVARVNRVSRAVSSGTMTLSESHEALEEIEKSKFAFSVTVQVLAAALSSACFVIMFQGHWYDFIPALLAGGLGFIGFLFFSSLVSVKFISEFLAAVIIGLVSYLLVQIGFGHEIDKIIIGSVMPLVPGLLITNAVRDLMAGHLVSGLSKGADAFLTSFAIGGGIAIALTLF
ncbi:threonine/serine exporter family protein [Bacillus testis]|uniref:threonine/serine exporter family protein n=1 Tax=Bacillus testis TaxID=1622072 RepID=UPI00067EAFD8|nr:threonine/serine exporter family protein [Bacillus testis]